MKRIIYDIETLKATFMYVSYDVQEDKFSEFILSDYQDDWKELLKYLGYLYINKYEAIGFNNVAFDAQVIQWIMVNHRSLSGKSVKDRIDYIYNYSQQVIEKRNNNEWADYKEKDLLIPQIDLFKIHHLDNRAKTSSLKGIQVAMNWHNVQDMPIHHSKEYLTVDEIEIVLDYCKNDVFSTYEFYKVTVPKIELREKIRNRYGIECINYSNTKIGSELLLTLYCQRTNKNYWETKKLRTYRTEIVLKDIIFPYINFKSKEFNNLLHKLNDTIITGTKGTFKKQVTYKGFTYEIAQGGIHGCIKPGIYLSDKDHIILDADVGSLYPNIAIQNNLYPEHLGKEFCKVYKEDIVDVRLKEKAKGKEGDITIVDGFKEASNATFGNSNSQFSWLYDPKYTMQTTINGQLMLCMLSEMLNENIALTMLQVNTDGITVKIYKDDINKYYEICKQWEKITNLQLEYAEYKMMCIRDVKFAS